MFDVIRSILEEGPICEDCLGRQFAKLSTNLSNKQRGRAIKLMVAMLDNRPIDANICRDERENCWVCGGLFSRLDVWVDRCVETLKGYEFDNFLIGTKLSGRLSENEEILWVESKITTAEPLRSHLNREVGKRIENITSKRAEFKEPEILIILNLARGEIELTTNPIFIYGRYKKFVRGFPQTRWPCRECRGKGCSRCAFTGKMYFDSVQEIIAGPILAVTEGADVTFHGAGREDIDALMLGTGRPFVLEVKRPVKRYFDLKRLESTINCNQQKVAVSDLKFVHRDSVEKVKNAKSDKVYRLKLTYEGALNRKKLKQALTQLEGRIEQITPKRVSHRRAEITRIRTVHSAKLDGGYIFIKCEGGLYVKELISGDGGRTKPNLSELIGIPVKVEELDVLEVNGGL
jgi:tRNA pseudouridine synthase 10